MHAQGQTNLERIVLGRYERTEQLPVRLGQQIRTNPPSVPAPTTMTGDAGGDHYRDQRVMKMVAIMLPRCAIDHRRDIQRYRGQAGFQIATLFERDA